ncbi:MAG: hypothetical protein ACRCZB_07510 [Bacteroidales bacterium]
MRRIYDIDLYKLLRMLLPSTLRGSSTVVAMLEAMFTPMQRIYSKFTQYGDSIEKQLSYSSQTCRMRAMLNDEYDPILRRIRVENKKLRSFTSVYRREENLPLAICQVGVAPPVMLTRLEDIEFDGGFNILLPQEIYANAELVGKIGASVDRDRLVTRYFSIKSI